MKTCIRCKQTLQLNCFSKRKISKDGLLSVCKTCTSTDHKTRIMARDGTCHVVDCHNQLYTTKYCSHHAYLKKQYGSFDEPNNNFGKGCIDSHGYRVYSIDNKQYREHRLVMESFLQRKLYDNENVHHINGDRLDNRIENLELWNTSQPSGQRIYDKIQWAKEILQIYESLQSEEDAHYW